MQVSGLHVDGERAAGESEGAQRPSEETRTDDHRYSGGRPGTRMEPDGDTRTRDEHFELRDALRPISGLERLARCGISVLAGGVTPVLRNGRAGFAGVVTCGSVHVCPCCATTIRRVRQDELEQVGQFWECQRCGLVLMTLTMRHYERDALADLAEMQRQAWKRGFGMNAGRTWREAKKAFGVRGFVRAWEVTHGPNGWHVHYHVLLFLARPLASGDVERLQHTAYEVWADALVKVGARMPVEVSERDGKPVAVRIDAPDRGESGTLARYLMKGQDGKTRWGVAAELTRQDAKQGQGGHRTPMQIARAAVAEDADPRDIELWQEFVQTATGMRALYWSNGLRTLLAEMGFELDDRTDGQVAADEAAAGRPLAVIPSATWYRHVARHKGRALALLRAGERGGQAGVRTLIESWGLVWGADVVEPDDCEARGTELPTAAEVLRRMERADLAARAEVWRTEFDRQQREDRRRAADASVTYQPDAMRSRVAQLAAQRAEMTDAERAAAHAEFRARLRAARQA